jgi:uncharacterized protein
MVDGRRAGAMLPHSALPGLRRPAPAVGPGSQMPQSAMLGALIAGLLGGMHCVAMCGGWVAATSGPGQPSPLLPARALRASQWAGHAGRLVTYALLGAVFGAVGGAVYGIALRPLQQAVYILANVFLLGLALSLALRGLRWEVLERVGLAGFRRLLPMLPLARAGGGVRGRFALGLVWGATPCALVYGVLPVAMLAGSAANGALVMLAFGLGTLPNLWAAGWLFARLRQPLARPQVRMLAAGIVGAFALLGIYRAVFVPEALGQGPFCLTG